MDQSNQQIKNAVDEALKRAAIVLAMMGEVLSPISSREAKLKLLEIVPEEKATWLIELAQSIIIQCGRFSNPLGPFQNRIKCSDGSVSMDPWIIQRGFQEQLLVAYTLAILLGDKDTIVRFHGEYGYDVNDCIIVNLSGGRLRLCYTPLKEVVPHKSGGPYGLPSFFYLVYREISIETLFFQARPDMSKTSTIVDKRDHSFTENNLRNYHCDLRDIIFRFMENYNSYMN